MLNHYNDLKSKIVVETTTVTLQSNWTGLQKANHTLISAKSLREDATYYVTGFSKSSTSFIVFFSDANTGAQLQVQAIWVKTS